MVPVGTVVPALVGFAAKATGTLLGMKYAVMVPAPLIVAVVDEQLEQPNVIEPVEAPQ
jgi:hypothetical protein